MNKTAQKAINPFTGKPVTKEFRIKQIKSWINQMPWDSIGGGAPNLDAENPVLGPKAMGALDRLNKLGEQLGMQSLITGTFKAKEGDLDAAADILFDAKSELTRVIKGYEKYHQHVGSKIWTLEEKIKAMSESEYPGYFPQLWHPQNVGSYVGGYTHGQFGCRPGHKKPGEGRKKGEGACQTPYYNHFVMWGPNCARCGATGPDPRYLKMKRMFPHLFTHEQIKARVLGKKRSFFITSPGIAPYMKPPAPGTVYKNAHDPDLLDKEVRSEGLKFMSAEDEQDYWNYLTAFNKFKKQEMAKAETVAYMEEYLKRFPYKLKALEHGHDHDGPRFLDPSKLGPKGAGEDMSDQDKLLSIAEDFEKKAQFSPPAPPGPATEQGPYPIDKKKLYDAIVSIFGKKVPTYMPVLFKQEGDKKPVPGIILYLSWKQASGEGVAPKLSNQLAQKLGVKEFIAYVKFLSSA